MPEPSPRRAPEVFFRACLLILAGICALYFALALLAKIWFWLLLAAGITLAVVVGVWAYRYWWGGRG